MAAKRALLTGQFSSVGDIECLEVVQAWLDEVDIPYDTAPFVESVRAEIPGGSQLEQIDPSSYSHLVMIGGTVWKEQLEKLQFDFSRFSQCVRIGVNLTLLAPLESWNPFDVLLERDSNRSTRPDLSMFADTGSAPVVGRCTVQKQSLYSGSEEHEQASKLFGDLIRRHDFAAIDMDTRWYLTENGLRSPAHFISALRRTDLFLTNRLHGLVYALKAGIPVIVIDAIPGGAKVTAQADTIGWPQCIPIERATPQRLDAAVEWCFSPRAQQVMRSCREGVIPKVWAVKCEFLAALGADIPPPSSPEP